jgi:HAD superfamily hydrolase (TIGR01509 family)
MLADAASRIAFLLDMDGVLIHSTPIHNEAWRRYLERHGIVRDLESIQRVMLGKHNDDIVRAFLGNHLSPAEIARHGAEKEKLYRELMAPRLEESLVAGVREFLRRYRHVPMGLASNAEPANVDFVLERSGLRPFFRAVLDGQQVARPKPDPEIYVKLARQLGVAPQEAIVFEDSATGIEAARRAGARVVGVATTTAELDGASITVRDFRDPALEAWLARLGVRGEG